jgi:GcrA cell cycle regulator
MTRDEIIKKAVALRSTHTATQIAEQIGQGLTRNAVIGIWARHAPLTASKRRPRPAAPAVKTPPAHTQKSPPPKPAVAPAAIPPTYQPQPAKPAAEPIGLTLLQLDRRSCHWVLPGRSAAGESRYCGLPTVAGRAYCDCHLRLMYTSTPKVTVRNRDGARRPSPIY